jgi:two-component system, sensor histidine kinase
MPGTAEPAIEETLARLEADNRKLRKINQVLMDRVERDMNVQGGNAFSLFQTAITLEGKISERTAELSDLTHRLMHEISQRRQAETALLNAKGEAERANLSKTRFLAAASHDLHQPLNAARLFLGALADEVSGERELGLIERIEAALETVDELLNALLDISKLDTGAWPIEVSSFAVGPLLQRLADEYAPQARAYGLRLSAVASSAVVRTDRTLLERAIRNFISNAIRYTDTGRILIGGRGRGSHVSVEVWDTGIGIPAEKHARIFEEFRQLGTSVRRHEKGLGLGLAIVERIARLLDLKIEVESRIGHGSKFAVLVPRNELQAGSEELVNAALAEPATGDGFDGRLVLCIDNDAQVLEGMAELTIPWGCELVAAVNVAQALESIGQKGRSPDLLIADYHLDDEELGTDAIELLRTRFGQAIPALIISSNRTTALRAELKARGLSFLPKPIAPGRLRAMMSYPLGQRVS